MIIAAVPRGLRDRRAMDRGACVSRGILEVADLPPLLATVVRPWVIAIETGTLGMRDEVAAAATGTAASLRRRVVVPPGLEMMIAEAATASTNFAETLSGRGVGITGARAAALAALEAVIERLKTAAPSEDTRALGLGW